MFPLGNPIVPHAGMPLHVFEERYRTLMRHVTAGDRRFGIVMIDRGSEVGGGDERTDVGVMVEVADEEELDDGRWVLLAVGLQRIRIVEWLPDDPYPRAVIEQLPEPPITLDVASSEIQAQVRRIAGMLTELGEPAPPVTLELDDDPVVAAWQAVAVSPVGPLDTQRLLDMDDPDRRVTAILEALDDAEELLRLRMAG
jgi:Lon protease-like protein